MKKYSILSLVLIAASAVTAAFIPGKSAQEAEDFAVQDSTSPTGIDQTCKPGIGIACTYTATVSASNPNGSGTSLAGNKDGSLTGDTGTQTTIRS